MATRRQGHHSVTMANKSAGTWAGAHSPYTQMLFTRAFNNHVEHLLCARLCSGP